MKFVICILCFFSPLGRRFVKRYTFKKNANLKRSKEKTATAEHLLLYTIFAYIQFEIVFYSQPKKLYTTYMYTFYTAGKHVSRVHKLNIVDSLFFSFSDGFEFACCFCSALFLPLIFPFRLTPFLVRFFQRFSLLSFFPSS